MSKSSGRSDQRASGEGWRRFISHERIYQHVWKDKDGGTLYLHLRHSAKNTTGARARIRGAGYSEPRRLISGLLLSPQKAASRLTHDYRANTKALSCRTSSEPPYTKLAKLPTKRTSCTCARVLSARYQINITYTMEKSSPLTPKSQPRCTSYFSKPYHSTPQQHTTLSHPKPLSIHHTHTQPHPPPTPTIDKARNRL